MGGFMDGRPELELQQLEQRIPEKAHRAANSVCSPFSRNAGVTRSLDSSGLLITTLSRETWYATLFHLPILSIVAVPVELAGPDELPDDGS
ncbi:hypothetical protein [Mesorhizobium sp. M0491]|uniref:hypothetical protein n=1 Tax=Mesorhizobium sp. M0491 TaxID=2956950 RepID=UPI00333B6E36